MAEPDGWLGHLFASRFEAAIAGYRTLLQVTDLGEGRQQMRTPLTRNDPGFQEILELALDSAPYVRDYIAKKQIGPIETMIIDGHSGVGIYQGYSSVEHPFRTPFSIRLEDRHGKGVSARLGYKESDLKERFFMPRLRWWALFALYAGFIINVLLLFP
jgi:hypothetical protein